MKNVIVLGGGRTGSSPLAGLISHNRYSINKEAIRTRRAYPDGDYENPELIKLNKDILLESGYDHTKLNRAKRVDIDAIKNFAAQTDTGKYQTFVNRCNDNAPWLWKDPRLCFTVYFWKTFLNFDNIHIVYISRDKSDIFRSYMKYQVYYTRNEVFQMYDEQIAAIENFLNENKLDALRIHYNELMDSNKIIKVLNEYIGINITKSDYEAVYKPNIRQKESEFSFWKRYYWGLTKLIIGRILKYPGNM